VPHALPISFFSILPSAKTNLNIGFTKVHFVGLYYDYIAMHGARKIYKYIF
jgi:hypothetical protein